MRIQTKPFAKVAASTAAEICARVDLSPEARAFLLPNLSPQGYLALLVDAQHIGDAVRFLAFALPVREGVWWSCVVAKNTLTEFSDIDKRCLEEASAWVYEPVEQRRRSCMVVSESANFEGAAAYAALAVFWSGGSMAPEGMPEAPPDPRLGHIGVGASILLSITAGDPLRLQQRFEEAIARGIDIANGGNGNLEGGVAAVGVPSQ
ncbi:hypothetical protein [Mesorhizobium sp. CAU 1741]|uniref:DUF6931 family protein n=1 Tax=Mesorhizobium sp. CAU 1741 TaxID=3140366 RepID=UPI00325B7F46